MWRNQNFWVLAKSNICGQGTNVPTVEFIMTFKVWAFVEHLESRGSDHGDMKNYNGSRV